MPRPSVVRFLPTAVALLAVFLAIPGRPAAPAVAPALREADVIVVGATPAGIMAAVAAARNGKTVIVLERSAHPGGLPANGLGATDISTRGSTAGLFLEFITRIREHYLKTYGPTSEELAACQDGYHFEPSVAEKVFAAMLDEVKGRITVLLRRQFDSDPKNVTLQASVLVELRATNLEANTQEAFRGKVFVDATYEGDLAAAAGAPYRVGREAQSDYNEPRAGKLYCYYEPTFVNAAPGEGTTGAGDNAVQAYNYRLCLTDQPENRVAIPRPASYNRAEYVSLVEDIRLNRSTLPPGGKPSREWDGMGRVVTLGDIPRHKTDGNHQASAFLSTDLAEENWPWPTSNWAWRDRYAQRLRDYTIGLLWFIQHDDEVPAEIRRAAAKWGLAADEYQDNDHFPRQPYIREGRRVMGDWLFTARDAVPRDGVGGKERPPVHEDSITSSHYHLDSHATLKREDGRIGLEGFFSLKGTAPYTVPYGTMVPQKVEQLLVPVALSATHIGLSTLRMEPCWMALGQAAGVAASLSISRDEHVRAVSLRALQARLVENGAMLIYYRDVTPTNPHFAALQYFGLRQLPTLDRWEARLDEAPDPATARDWIAAAGNVDASEARLHATTRGELLDWLYVHTASHDVPAAR